MSTCKTKFDQKAAEAFLTKHLDSSDIKVQTIADGEESQAFFFSNGGQEYILRVSSHTDNGFRKDKYAHEVLNSPQIPVPKILEVGSIKRGLYFAISERAVGKTLDKFSKEEIKELMPRIIASVEAMHAHEPMGEGYGQWDLMGKGYAKTWREVLEDSLNQDDEETKSAEFYDAEFQSRLREDIKLLFDDCPEERRLIHDDYGFNNALSDGKNITGLIDWEHGAYGDPIRDIAWLDFWGEEHGFAEAFKSYYIENDILPDNFDKRLVCYKLMVGLSSTGFFARSRQENSYNFSKSRVNNIRKSLD